MSTVDLVRSVDRLVMEALDAPYSSFSSTDDSETGNRYQAVEFGDFVTRGQREGRAHFLDAIDFDGKQVLDLGSNLGEISRQVRARGAWLVDGFEYDPYFVEVANLVNVAAGTTRVSFFERDISDPEIYVDRYDIVLAFSVMRFIADCLDRLAAVTDVVLFEGHTVSGNFEERYMKPLTRWFPVYRVLGESDSERLRQDDVRPVLLMARDEDSLQSALAPHLRDGGRAAGALAAGSRERGMRGAIDLLSVEPERVQMEGWCLDAAVPHDLVELEAPGQGHAVQPKWRAVMAVADPHDRPDVAAAFPQVPHAGRSGFALEYCPAAPLSGHVRLDVAAYRGPQRLGKISAWHLDGMYDDMPEPPAALAEHHWGTAEPSRLALAAVGVASSLTEAAGRYKRLELIGSVLDWGCGIGLVERYLARILPDAALTAVDWDTEAMAWAGGAGLPGTFETIAERPPTGLPEGGFELVLGHATLSRQRFDRQSDWLDELHRLVTPGGWVVLTLLGEVALRFLPAAVAAEIAREGVSKGLPTYQTKAHTIALCAERFDVVSYVEGGRDGLHDLVVLYRP